MSFYDEMLKIADEWAEQEGATAIDAEAVVDYALRNRLYQRKPPTQREMCLRDMRVALQRAKFLDAQGNLVRSKHALRLPVVGDQMELPLVVYVDPRTAKPDQMFEAFKQNLERIKNDVKRHSVEKHSFDLNNIYNATLPGFDYDFNAVAQEATMTGEYDDSYEAEEIPDPELVKE